MKKQEYIVGDVVEYNNEIHLTLMESNVETYYMETCGRTYFRVEDNVIHAHGKRITMPKQKLLDFIATAKELGIIAGKL